MDEPPPPLLAGRHLLVVEDEFLIAAEMRHALERLGAAVIGPAGSVEAALRLIETREGRIDGAVLDVNLKGMLIFPVADALARHRVPFVFVTGYDAGVIPAAYRGVPRLDKPVEQAALARVLAQELHSPAGR